MRARTLKVLGLTAVPALLAWSTIETPLRMQPTSRLWVNGTSTVKSFECGAKSFDAIVQASVPDAVASVLAGEKGVSAVELKVPAAQLDCKNDKMNEHMLKALKAKDFANISFKLDSYDLAKVAEGTKVTINGTLTLGGVSKPITMSADAVTGPDGALKVSGKYPLKMTEYGLQPPKLMLGALKVHELVNVSFELLLKP